MPNTTHLIFESDVFVEGVYCGYSTTKIKEVNLLQKRIYLNDGVVEYHPVEDIYKELRFIRRTDISLRVIRNPVSAGGNVSKGGGKFTPRYAVFNNGWKVVPQDITHSLYITGEQITDDGQSGPSCLDTSVLDPSSAVTIHYEPPTAELITVGGSEMTPADVWAHPSRTLTSVDVNAIALAVQTELQDKFDAIAPNIVADAVRTALTAELARIDVNISTRQPVGVVQANVKFVNDAAVSGTGQPGNEWGPA